MPAGAAGTYSPLVYHMGGGGGGSSSFSVAGFKIIEAGGGGGGGAAHHNSPRGNGGAGGFNNPTAGVYAGNNGSAGVQGGGTVNGGQGGQKAIGVNPPVGGNGGVNTSASARNGTAGAGPGTGTGGNGGPDDGVDSGGGGGGGYTGGGGGAATVGDGNTGGGGGGGSSFIAATSPTVTASAPSSVSGSTNAGPASGVINGPNGEVTLAWVPCLYTLNISKAVATSPVNAGGRVVWTVAVTNIGPDPMTRGDTVTLNDTLPGPVGSVTPTYKVLSIGTSGGANADMDSGAFTCSGVTVNSTMPASTTCSRDYNAPAAPGSPTGGSRGLNSGETLTITYEQIIPNTAACTTITNTASALDRTTAGSTTLRSFARNLQINCYDLAVTKFVSPTAAGAGNTLTWSIDVTNTGPGDMMGPDDTASNPLIVTDVAPTANVSAPTAFTTSGPAGACTYASNTITCPAGLAFGETQSFTFQQTINTGTAGGTVISNTASVSDPKTGDANDSFNASVTTQATLTVRKAWGVNSIGTDVANVPATTGGASNTNAFTAAGGVAGSSNTVNVSVGNTINFPAETFSAGTAANYTTVLACTAGGGATANTLTGTNGQVNNTLTIGAGDAGKAIICTYTNTRRFTNFRLRKVWSANSIAANVANLGATTGLINNTVAFNSTASTNTNGATVRIYAGEVATLPVETMSTGIVANYNTVIACNAGTLAGTNGQASGNTVTFTTASMATATIQCTYTNTRKTTTFRLAKAWGANSIAGNVARIGATSGLISNTVAFNSTASTDLNGATITIRAGETATLPAETMTTGTLANYSTVITCNAGTLIGTDGQVTGNTFLVSAADMATSPITCTYTNTRKSATMTLRKTWSGATNGHTATVASAGFINVATSGVSTSTGNNTTAGTAVTVYAGESGTISETGSNMASYIQSLACSGTSGLSGTTLTVSNADTAITCTYTNTLAVPLLTITKTPSVPSVSAAGVAIGYTIRVANDGNVDVTSTTVTDPLGTVSCPGGNPIPALAIGTFVDCSMNYTVTQAVFDSNGGGDGDIDNTASANGTTAYGAVSQTGNAVVTLTGTPALALSKTRVFLPGPSGDVNGNGTADVGDIITYRYDVTNTGNRTVAGVNINLDNHNGYGSNPLPSNEVVLTDVAPANDSTDGAVNASWDSLAPGDSVRFTWAYTVVQADIDLLQ